MRFARVVYLLAGTYGLIVVAPGYFLEARIGRDFPPAITHPEYFYGFLGVTIAWQILFLVLAMDPLRFRAMILPSILEKVGFGIPAIFLFIQHRIPLVVLSLGSVDWILAGLFVAAYISTGRDH
ncbi:MAG: hypothetical protein LAO08_00240 [Acidobacteriia bacterium]|nr:hypothetical protein [Terriglobia bacterium]